MALRAILFGAVGTAGQRCTSTRRIIVHASVRDELVRRLVKAYEGIPSAIQGKRARSWGPLVAPEACATCSTRSSGVKEEGGEVSTAGKRCPARSIPAATM